MEGVSVPPKFFVFRSTPCLSMPLTFMCIMIVPTYTQRGLLRHAGISENRFIFPLYFLIKFDLFHQKFKSLCVLNFRKLICDQLEEPISREILGYMRNLILTCFISKSTLQQSDVLLFLLLANFDKMSFMIYFRI